MNIFPLFVSLCLILIFIIAELTLVKVSIFYWFGDDIWSFFCFNIRCQQSPVRLPSRRPEVHLVYKSVGLCYQGNTIIFVGRSNQAISAKISIHLYPINAKAPFSGLALDYCHEFRLMWRNFLCQSQSERSRKMGWKDQRKTANSPSEMDAKTPNAGSTKIHSALFHQLHIKPAKFTLLLKVKKRSYSVVHFMWKSPR